jgi:hypothetical protein
MPWARPDPAAARDVAGEVDYRMRGVNRDVMAMVESNHRVVLQAASLRVCRFRHVATPTV